MTLYAAGFALWLGILLGFVLGWALRGSHETWTASSAAPAAPAAAGTRRLTSEDVARQREAFRAGFVAGRGVRERQDERERAEAASLITDMVLRGMRGRGLN